MPLNTAHAFDQVFEVVYDPLAFPSEWLHLRKGGVSILINPWDYLTEVIDGVIGCTPKASVNTSPHDLGDFARAEFEHCAVSGLFLQRGPGGAWAWNGALKPDDAAVLRVGALVKAGTAATLSGGGIQGMMWVPMAGGPMVVQSTVQMPLRMPEEAFVDLDPDFLRLVQDNLGLERLKLDIDAMAPRAKTPKADDPYYTGRTPAQEARGPAPQRCYLDGRVPVRMAGGICDDCREKYLTATKE